MTVSTTAAAAAPVREHPALAVSATPPAPTRLRPVVRSGRRGRHPVVPDAGMASAEYAVALIAACAFAAVLLAAIRAGAVLSAVGALIRTALKVIS